MNKQWVPWQLAPDSDPKQRWILVNAQNDGEEHPRNYIFATKANAEQYVAFHTPCQHGNYIDDVCGLCHIDDANAE